MWEAVLIVFWWLVILFWVVQGIDVMVRHPSYFDNHTHKLVWFLVVLIGNIVGAVWYFVWVRRCEGAKLRKEIL